MKKKIPFILTAAAILLLGACTKPAPDDPGKDDKSTEITSNNATPGGFEDDGPTNWDN